MNAPLTKENDLAITHLEDIHCDAGLIEKSADKTNYIFFETPFVPNEIMYQDFLMNRFACKFTGFKVVLIPISVLVLILY